MRSWRPPSGASVNGGPCSGKFWRRNGLWTNFGRLAILRPPFPVPFRSPVQPQPFSPIRMESDVRTIPRLAWSLSVCAGLLVGLSQLSEGKPIEAVKGKAYSLTKKNGPWMVMVASFHEPPGDRKSDGMTPEQAANELVYELRKMNIPAYTYAWDDVIDEVQDAPTREGRPVRLGKYVSRQKSIGVLAGNYQEAAEKLG